MASPEATTLRRTLGRSIRFASLGLRRAEIAVDLQSSMDELAAQNLDEAEAIAQEIALDALDDRRRFFKYQALEHAMRRGDLVVARQAFYSLVSHIEADEMREDARRLPRKQVRELHAVRIRELRRIFHDDVVPAFVGDEAVSA